MLGQSIVFLLPCVKWQDTKLEVCTSVTGRRGTYRYLDDGYCAISTPSQPITTSGQQRMQLHNQQRCTPYKLNSSAQLRHCLAIQCCVIVCWYKYLSGQHIVLIKIVPKIHYKFNNNYCPDIHNKVTTSCVLQYLVHYLIDDSILKSLYLPKNIR